MHFLKSSYINDNQRKIALSTNMTIMFKFQHNDINYSIIKFTIPMLAEAPLI